MPARSHLDSSSPKAATRAPKKMKVTGSAHDNLTVSKPDVETVDFEDLFVEKLVIALRNRMPKDAEIEKRERSIVLAGLPKTPMDRQLLERKQQLEKSHMC
ncbi:unnamed protein product [Cylicocyclus nassatus]|uniref:Uncharacterized protein n=1 Tax=Cylicocyclus nassatus TaxID=53992 RepID=A0AA36H0Y9_CYLNA|nr:unnamed protein product [Cylicocyclus nassatus]